VVVLLERKTSTASSLAGVYISPESPFSVDFHRLPTYPVNPASIPPSLPLHLTLSDSSPPCTTFFPVRSIITRFIHAKPQLAKQGLFHVPFTSSLSYSFSDSSLPSRLLEDMTYVRTSAFCFYLVVSTCFYRWSRGLSTWSGAVVDNMIYRPMPRTTWTFCLAQDLITPRFCHEQFSGSRRDTVHR
jgi:hypothetical protein